MSFLQPIYVRILILSLCRYYFFSPVFYTSPLSFPFQTFIQEIELNQINRIWYVATVFTLILEFFILTKCDVNISQIEGGSPQT